ncbi:hypothetical protein Adt_03643 [Abeliophyllum distichum]|uniref:Uncharacterized protein n=1 Tax=Abeliophyllum distichum TaxID=126358 RepID=A0ABD1VZH7_9LAMI
MTWSRGQEEETSSGRMVERIDDDEVLSPAPLTLFLRMSRLPRQTGTSGDMGGRPLGRREKKVEFSQRTAPIWKCRFFFSEVNEKQLTDWHRTYMIPDEIEFFVPGLNDRDDDLSMGCVALNQAVLAAGLQLGFPRPSAWEFNSLYSFKSDGKRSGWWYALVKVKTGGSVATQTPDSIKNWKKIWLFVRGYISHDPTLESIERARRARAVDESFRSSSALITEENFAAARLSPTTSHRPQPQKEARPGRVKEKLLLRTNLHLSELSLQTEEAPKSVPESSMERRGDNFIPDKWRAIFFSSLLSSYLGSTPDRDEEYLKLCISIPKPVCDFFRSNSPTRCNIVELSSSARRAISVMAKSWTPVQQKYLDGMGTVESIVAAKEDELKVLADGLEAANKSRAELEHELEVERKTHAEMRTALEKSVDKEEVVAEFKSSDAYLAEQEMVYFLTMEEMIDTTVEKCPDWDVQFLKDELSELKKKSILNPPSPEEVDQDQTGVEE